MGIALALHVLFAVIWVGGMFFAYVCLRPSLCDYDAQMKTTLWAQVLRRFFFWVRTAAAMLLLSGLYMIWGFGGMKSVGPYVHIMLALGLVMMALYLHAYFAPFRRLLRAVDNKNWSFAAEQVNQIRALVGINLCLGLLVVVIATAGRYYLHG
jgi:uncharacterized membrane protein